MRIQQIAIHKGSTTDYSRNETVQLVVAIFFPWEFYRLCGCRPARNAPSGTSVKIMQPYDFRLGGWDKIYLSPAPPRAISDGDFGKLWGLWGL